MKYFLILFVSIILWINCVYSDETNDVGSSLYCSDLRPQQNLNMALMMGMWYGQEIITHHDTEKIELDFDACVVLHFAEITHEMSTTRPRRPDGVGEYVNRQITYYDYDNNRIARPNQYHYLRLTWVENDLNLEYTLRYNTSRPGFWISSSPQKGTMTRLNYNQFSGSIQVLKVVGDHMVLTFCQSLPRSQLFSIVVSREPRSLTVDDLQSIRSLLKDRGLSTTNTRRVCNGANKSIEFTMITLIAPILLTIGLKTFI